MPFVPAQRTSAGLSSKGGVPSPTPVPEWLDDVVAEALTDGWRSAVADQLGVVVTGESGRVSTRRVTSRFDCRVLADLAEELEKAKEWAHDTFGALAGKAVKGLGRSAAEQALAISLAERIPLPGDEQIDQVVRALRIVGVYVCVVAGADLLRCPCLIALAQNRAKEELKQVLQEGLDAAVWPGSGLLDGVVPMSRP